MLNQALGWRSIQWFLAILGGCILVFVILCLPETLQRRKSVVSEAEEEVAGALPTTDEKTAAAQDTVRPTMTRTTTKQSVQVKTKTYLTVLQRCFVDPLRIVLYLQFPAVAVCVFYATTTFMALYMINISVQQTFSAAPYNYPSIIVGLLYIPNSLGYFITSIFGGRWVDRIMAREARKAGRYDEKGRLVYRPEDRMRENVWIAAIMFPASIMVYGWTATYGVNVAAPLVANFFFGIGSMLCVFSTLATRLLSFFADIA